MLLLLISTSSRGNENLLFKGDSLFNLKKYSQAKNYYDSLYFEEELYTNSMLLKLAFIENEYGNFEKSIADREKDSLILENTLIRIVDCQIIEGSVDGSDVFIITKIISEQINVTRNNEGDTVDGDPEHIATITDIWTFSRNTNDKDPNWELVATRSVE